eukprot:scaffold1849_cov115-Cylindrotheca_fusiformis.AAC.9
MGYAEEISYAPGISYTAQLSSILMPGANDMHSNGNRLPSIPRPFFCSTHISNEPRAKVGSVAEGIVGCEKDERLDADSRRQQNHDSPDTLMASKTRDCSLPRANKL